MKSKSSSNSSSHSMASSTSFVPLAFSHETDYTRENLPPSTYAVQSAIDFVKQVKINWTKGRMFQERGQVVHTFNTRVGSDFWMARVSHHPAFKNAKHNKNAKSTDILDDSKITFDVFKRFILEKHTENEVKYIPLLESFRTHEDEPSLIPEDSEDGWKAFTVHYKFPRLFSDREMAIWILSIQPDPEVPQFFVISLPSSHEVSSDVTRAVYCAIEVITYKEEEGHVEWLMAQTSDARGSIPRWIQDKSVTASVASDVPSFIEWAIKEVEKNPEIATKSKSDN